jgi:hypothetical protein
LFSGKFAPRVRFLSLLGTSAGYLIQRVPGNTFQERTFRGGAACTYLTGLQGKDNVDARLIHQIMGRDMVVANTDTRSRGKVRHQRNARERVRNLKLLLVRMDQCARSIFRPGRPERTDLHLSIRENLQLFCDTFLIGV